MIEQDVSVSSDRRLRVAELDFAAVVCTIVVVVTVTHALRVLIVFLCGSSVSSGSRKTTPVSGISPAYKRVIWSRVFWVQDNAVV